MHTIDALIRKGLWLTLPSALAILFGIAANIALHDDGLYVGHPRTEIIYSNPQTDPRLQQLAAAIDVPQLRRK